MNKFDKNLITSLYQGNHHRFICTIKKCDQDHNFLDEIIKHNDSKYTVTKKSIDGEIKQYIQIYNTYQFNKNEYSYLQSMHCSEPRKSNSCFVMQRCGDFGWVYGIIVSKKDIIDLNEIEITIGGLSVCKISIRFLLKISSNEIDDNLIHIAVPKQLLISDPIDHKLTNPMGINIINMCAFPMFHLLYHEVRFHVSTFTGKVIDYWIIQDYTIARYLRFKRGNFERMYYEDDYNENELYREIQYQQHMEDCKNHEIVDNEHLSLGLTSCTRFRCKDQNELNHTITNITSESLKKYPYFSTSKMCIGCFNKIIKTNKCTTYTLRLYLATRFNTINELKLLPGQLNELIIEYDSFDRNHVIILYEEIDDSLECYKIYHNVVKFSRGMIQDIS